MRSLLYKNRRRRQSRRKQQRGGGYANWQVSYNVECSDDLSAKNLFSMGTYTLRQMATVENYFLDETLLGHDNFVIMHLPNLGSNGYRVQFDIHFASNQTVPADLHDWKLDYIAGIQNELALLNANDGMYTPIDASFQFEPLEEVVYPDYIEPSPDARDV